MRRAKLVCLPVSLVLLSGCAREIIVATAEPLCEAVAHVCIAREDRLTEGTAVQIEANNLGRGRVCAPPAGGDPCAAMRVKPAVPVPARKEAKTS